MTVCDRRLTLPRSEAYIEARTSFYTALLSLWYQQQPLKSNQLGRFLSGVEECSELSGEDTDARLWHLLNNVQSDCTKGKFLAGGPSFNTKFLASEAMEKAANDLAAKVRATKGVEYLL